MKLDFDLKRGCGALVGTAALLCGAYGVGCTALTGAAAHRLEVSPDGALKTPAAALAKIRAERAAGAWASNETVEVRFAGGTYALDETLAFDGDSRIRFVGAADGSTVFSGGIVLPRFRAGADGLWRASVPKDFAFDQLWVDGRRATRARSPNKFYHYIRQSLVEKQAFVGYPEDLKTVAALSPAERSNVVFRIYWSWETELNRLASVDAATGEVTLEQPLSYDFFNWRFYETRYVLENFRAALDAPGEWFLDRTAGELLYMPRPGETVERARAVAPRLEKLVSFDRAEDVRFERITLEYAGWREPRTFTPFQGAECVPFANVHVEESRGLSFHRCVLRHLSSYAFWFHRNVRDCSVTETLVEDGGAGGVKIGLRFRECHGENRLPDGTEPSGIVVDNCIFHDLGHVFPEGAGVFLTNAHSCRITRNEICDLYYSGVSLGWNWTYGKTCVHDNLVEWNHIHHYGKGVLSDMGGVYTLGQSGGTRICRNHIHDCYSYGYTGSGGAGLYQDQGSSHILWASNLVHGTKTSGLSLHYGKDNVFLNNVFAYNTKSNCSIVTCVRYEPHVSLVASNNVFAYLPQGAAFRRAGPKGSKDPWKDLVFGSNLWWCPDGVRTNDFMHGSWENWRAHGKDETSLFADPLFVDPARGNWHLRAGSPAVRIGYRDWDYERCGVSGDAAWVARARTLAIPPLEIAPVPRPHRPLFFRTGFEEFAAGEPPARKFKCHGKGIEVAEGVARSGRRCLRLTDSAATPNYEPFVECFVPSERAEREFTCSYALKVASTNANFSMSWREWPCERKKGGYASGLNLAVKNGRFTVTGAEKTDKGTWRRSEQRLGEVRAGAWYGIEVRFEIRPGERTTFAYTITDAAGRKTTSRTFGVLEKEFWFPTWIGFLSNGKADNTYLIDDFNCTYRYDE